MVGFNRCESPRAPYASEITANVRFPESGHSECRRWDQANVRLWPKADTQVSQ